MSDRKPNLLLIMTDQQHYKTLGITGNRIIRTPNFDGLGKEGVFFHQAFTPTPLCVPSRVCYFTGRYPHANRSDSNFIYMSDFEPDLTKILREAGYLTALSGKNHCYRPHQLQERFDFLSEFSHGGKKNPQPGTADYDVARHRHNAMYKLMLEDPFPPEQCPTARITDEAISFLDNRDAAKPFFLWLSYPDPHPPYMVAEPYAGMYDPKDVPDPPYRDSEFDDKPFRQRYVRQFQVYEEYLKAYGPDGFRKLRAVYYGMVTFIDNQIGRFLKHLEAKRLLDDTIILFCTDHGDYTGDHKLIRKSVTLYDSLIRIPLLFHWPKAFKARQVSDTMISVVDVAPTLLDLLGLEVPQTMQGLSAAPLLLGKTNDLRSEIYGEYGTAGEPFSDIDPDEFAQFKARGTGHLSRRAMQGRFKCVRTLDWKYVHYANGEGELYNLRDDPDELTNLFHRRKYAALIDEMKLKILNWLIDSEDTIIPELPGKESRGRPEE